MIPPPVPPFWDLLTGGAPVNEYSILGYTMLVWAYIITAFMIPMGIWIFYQCAKLVEEIIQRIIPDRRKPLRVR